LRSLFLGRKALKVSSLVGSFTDYLSDCAA
jgi:hypothetical protein